MVMTSTFLVLVKGNCTHSWEAICVGATNQTLNYLTRSKSLNQKGVSHVE